MTSIKQIEANRIIRVAQYPEQGRIELDIDIVGLSVDGKGSHTHPPKL
jgi:hypothetical protein